MSSRDAELLTRLQEITDQIRIITESIQNLVDELSSGKAISGGLVTIERRLKSDLGENVQDVEIVTSREIRIRPKRFLGSEIFRSVAEVVRKHGGRWDSGQRCFIIQPREDRPRTRPDT